MEGTRLPAEESRSGTHQQGWVGPLLWLRSPGARLSFLRALQLLGPLVS